MPHANPTAQAGRMGWNRSPAPMALYSITWRGIAPHGTVRPRMAPHAWQAPAGSAGREVPTELCFSSQLKEKERNKEGNETPVGSDTELCQAEVGALSTLSPPSTGLELHPTPQRAPRRRGAAGVTALGGRRSPLKPIGPTAAPARPQGTERDSHGTWDSSWTDADGPQVPAVPHHCL